MTEAAIREVARHAARPMVFPLSNPTSKTEAAPADILEWTGGRALVATGSPFDPVQRPEGRRVIGQANNVFIFPGVGLGLIASQAREASEEMFLAAHALWREKLRPDRLATGALYPSLSELRHISRAIAIEVARLAWASSPSPDQDPAAVVDRLMWYRPTAPTFPPDLLPAPRDH